MKNYIFFYLKFIVIIKQIIVSISEDECPYNTPIIRTDNPGECIKGDCLINEYETNVCSIKNNKIETQWLNNFIIHEFAYNYCNVDINTSFDGNLIAYFTYIEADTHEKRLFIVLNKNDGRPIKDENGKEIMYCFSWRSLDNLIREHPNVYAVKKSNNEDGQEYILSLSISDNVEIDDIVYGVIYGRTNYQLFDGDISSYVTSLLKLNNNNYLLGLLLSTNNQNYLKIYEINIDNLFNINIISSYRAEYESSNSKMMSCLKTEQQFIFCFFQKKDCNYYTIAVYDPTFENRLTDFVVQEDMNETFFFKGVHFAGEIAAFLYYDMDLNLETYMPFIKFIDYIDEDPHINNFFDDIEPIELNIENQNKDIELNNFIKISDYKLLFTSISEEKRDLYLTTINCYDPNNKKIKIRYYIFIFYKIYFSIKSILHKIFCNTYV